MRLEEEFKASARRANVLEEQIIDISNEVDEAAQQLRELRARAEEAERRESEARQAALDWQLKYEGGLAKVEADALRLQLDKSRKETEEAQRETVRHKQLSEIASLQAQTLGAFKAQHQEELQELKDYCTKLESKVSVSFTL